LHLKRPVDRGPARARTNTRPGALAATRYTGSSLMANSVGSEDRGTCIAALSYITLLIRGLASPGPTSKVSMIVHLLRVSQAVLALPLPQHFVFPQYSFAAHSFFTSGSRSLLRAERLHRENVSILGSSGWLFDSGCHISFNIASARVSTPVPD